MEASLKKELLNEKEKSFYLEQSMNALVKQGMNSYFNTIFALKYFSYDYTCDFVC